MLQYLDDVLSPEFKEIAFVSFFFSFAIALFLMNSEKKRQTFDAIPNFDSKKACLLVLVGFVGGTR